MIKERPAEIVLGKGTDKKTISPQQKEFNRLTKKIAQTQADIQVLSALLERIQQRAALEMRPLVEKHNACGVEMLRLLDRMFRLHKFNKTETRKLRQIIHEMSFDLVEEGHEEFKAMYNEYSPDQDYEDARAEEDAEKIAVMKIMANKVLGVTFDPDADLDTVEKVREYIDAKLREAGAADDARAAKAEARRAAKPKTEKQLAAEARRAAETEKKKAEEKKISQSVREVYMDLVKAFHPDREPDEAEKIRKTAILQRVTAAYEANDLLALLHLQLELERIDGNHLDGLADDKLRYFNKNLRNQLAELSDAVWEKEMLLAQLSNVSPFEAFNPYQIESLFDKDLKRMKKEIKRMNQELELLRDPAALKAWLKGF